MEDRYCDGCGNHIEKDGCVCDYQVVAKSELRKLVEEMRAEIHSKGCGCNGCEMLREYAGKLEQLTEG